jgi:vitamin B12 transporter
MCLYSALAKRRFSKLVFILITNLVFLSIGNIAMADETPTIVITPSRFEQDIKQVGSSISVIDKSEIEERKIQSLADLLRLVSGVQVLQSGGNGSITSVFIRGASSSQVLVMINNIPINDVNSGQFDFSDLSTLGIERIEILKGPQSVVYGSQALGGVINIITNQENKKNSSQIIAEGGSYGTQKYLAQANVVKDKVNANLGASFFDSHNISTANVKNGNPENDPYQNVSLNGNSTLAISKDTKINSSARYTKGKVELDTFDFERGAVDSLDYRQQREAIQTTIDAETKYEFWNPKIILGYNNENTLAKDPAESFNNYHYTSDTTSVQQQNILDLSEELKTLFGYSYLRNRGNNIDNYQEIRHVNSFFLEQFINLHKSNSISLGVRHDQDSSFGKAFTYRGSVSQELEFINSRIHTSYGTGFRAPSFGDLYFPNFSNPNLNAEKSRGYDIGIGTNYKMISTDITFFQTNFDDLISFNDQTFIPENIQTARSRGVESKLEIDFSNEWKSNITYTYLDARNQSTNTSLPRRARHQGGFSITNSSITNLLLRTDASFFANRVETNGKSMDDYLVVSALAQYEINKNILPYIRLQNLFDADYEDVRGYGTLGSGVYAGIEFRL